MKPSDRFCQSKPLVISTSPLRTLRTRTSGSGNPLSGAQNAKGLATQTPCGESVSPGPDAQNIGRFVAESTRRLRGVPNPHCRFTARSAVRPASDTWTKNNDAGRLGPRVDACRRTAGNDTAFHDAVDRTELAGKNSTSFY